jgi:hypothetical protein
MTKVTFVAISFLAAVLTSCGGSTTTTPTTGDSTTVVTDTTKVSDSTAVMACDTCKVAVKAAK